MSKFSILLVTGMFALGAAAGCGSDDDTGGGNTGGTTGSGGKGSGGSGSGGKGGSGGSGSGGSGSGGIGVGSGGSGGSTPTDGGDAGGEVGDDASTDASTDVPSGSDSSTGGDSGTSATMSFFVTSTKSMTGNLGGLAGADKRCDDLAKAAGVTGKTWAAYLSVEKAGPGGTAINAKDRIGTGPWFNAKGVMLAANLTDLHARKGDAKVFLDEKGNQVNGQWTGLPTPNEHDILTGTKADGTVYPARTCADWTSTIVDDKAWVGHSDGLGPMQMTSGTYTSWNASHENSGCNDTSPRGGAGRIYCFAK